MNPRMLRLPVGGLYSGKDEAFDQHVPYDAVAVRTNRPRGFASRARISASKELVTGSTYVATETSTPCKQSACIDIGTVSTLRIFRACPHQGRVRTAAAGFSLAAVNANSAEHYGFFFKYVSNH